MAAVDMRTSIRSTLLERFRRLDPGLVQVKVVLARRRVARLHRGARRGRPGRAAGAQRRAPHVPGVDHGRHPVHLRLPAPPVHLAQLAVLHRPGPPLLRPPRRLLRRDRDRSPRRHLGPPPHHRLRRRVPGLRARAAPPRRRHRAGHQRRRAALPHPDCRTRAQARSVTRTVALTGLGVTAVWSAFMYLITSVDASDELVTVFVLSLLGSLHATFWVVIMGVVLLNGALFPAWMVPAMFFLIGCGGVVSLATLAVASGLGVAIFRWLLLMALAAFLGYCLAVYITYLHVATADDAAADDGIGERHGGEEMAIQQEELPLEHGK